MEAKCCGCWEWPRRRRCICALLEDSFPGSQSTNPSGEGPLSLPQSSGFFTVPVCQVVHASLSILTKAWMGGEGLDTNRLCGR